MPGIATLSALPNRPNTATRPATTSPNAPIAAAPSRPVCAIGVIAKAITDTAAANTAIPTALACSFFPTAPKIAASPPTTTPNASNGGTAVVPNDAKGTSASASTANDPTTSAIPALILRNVLDTALSRAGVVFTFLRSDIIPNDKAKTAPVITAIIPIARPPESDSLTAALANR